MTIALQIRGGTVAGAPTLAARELFNTTDQRRILSGDGSNNHILGLKHKINGTVSPGVNDDAAAGYSVGSEWVDTTHATTWICVDSTTGAAVWQQMTPTTSYTADETTLHLASTVFSIKSTYVGQASITTLGTIGTGVWQGTVIGSTYGGTGINNAGRTLTVAANSGTLSFTSSVTLTIAATASISGTNTGDQSPGNPTAAVGLTPINGSATTYMRSDAAPTLDQTISPTMSGAWNFTNSTGVTVTHSALGPSSADGFVLTNSTAATATVPQYPPEVVFNGKGWRNDTSASQDASAFLQLRPGLTGGVTFAIGLLTTSAGSTELTFDVGGNLTITNLMTAGSLSIGTTAFVGTDLTVNGIVTVNGGEVLSAEFVSVQAINAAVVIGFNAQTSQVASAGAQKYSPSLAFFGSGWKTDATAAAQLVEFDILCIPIQGAAHPTGKLSFQFGVNLGSTAEFLSISSTAVIDSPSTLGFGTGTATAITIGGAASTTDLKGDIITPNLWTRYYQGFLLTYSTATTFAVGSTAALSPASLCRDKADVDFISLAAASSLAVDITTNGSALGNDSFTGTGNVTVTNSATISTGSVNNAWTTDFRTRLITGTFNTVTASTTVTGNGTKFLTDVAVNDLIGVAGFTHTSSFNRVTAIASDTSLTIATAVTYTAGDPISVIEQPTLTITGDTAGTHQVKQILADTGANKLILNEATTGGALSNAAIQIGRRIARAAASGAFWLFPWVGKGASGTTAFVSTQRTTPYGITNYNVSVRRLAGAILTDSSGNMVEWEQQEWGGGSKFNIYIAAVGTYRIVNGGVATTMTSFAGNTAIPPTSTMMYMMLILTSNTANGQTFVDADGKGTGRTSTMIRGQGAPSGTTTTIMTFVPTSGVQGMEYCNNSASVSCFLDVAGFVEVP